MRTCVAHMRTRGSFDFASIERARRILETDMLQFLIASVPLQSAKNSSYEDCSLSGQFWERTARYLNRMHQRGCRVDISCRNASGMRLFLSELDRFDVLPVLRLWFSAFLYISPSFSISVIYLFLTRTISNINLFNFCTFHSLSSCFITVLFSFYAIYIVSVLLYYFFNLDILFR